MSPVLPEIHVLSNKIAQLHHCKIIEEKYYALFSVRRTSLLARIVSCKSSHESSQGADVGAHLSADSTGSNLSKSEMCEGSGNQLLLSGDPGWCLFHFDVALGAKWFCKSFAG